MVQIRKSKTNRRRLIYRLVCFGVAFLFTSLLLLPETFTPKTATIGHPDVSFRSPLMYGTKSGNEQTAQLVKDAIHSGFRHVVTGGHHQAHNESGVGQGWRDSLVPRQDLFLQTCFVPWDGKDFQKQATDPESTLATIEEQVRLSIETSLRNLQTDYLDVVLFHNFRAKLYPYDQMIKAWRVLEDYVKQGTIRHLGISSVHDATYLERIMRDAIVKPEIIQNRFHSNRGYDVELHETFMKYNLQVQRFWLLNGSSGGGRKNSDMALKKNLTPAQLMLAFVMSFGSQTCLVGTHNLEHMKQDVDISKCYNSVFSNLDGDDTERNEYAMKLGMKPKLWT
eukprot:CAMPEP_0194259876 /NCGR_PEP_ID=MMETSP0158-20130606/44601_1 /TAXON_ID=33649 /ORGANISM="Thalassionema nitzschioides, Strain L26-B" /LENGTH=336 /DNA_ID=CAMNT_0038999843 /DNA_START=89 /DNA_END=1096 /DNA_ORIENTATION=-